MSAPSFERYGEMWARAMEHAPIDEQRSLVRLLETVSQPPQEQQRKPVVGQWLMAAAAVAVCVGLAGYGYQRYTRPTVVAEGATVVPGAWLETRRDQKIPMQFSEGSQVVVAEASRVRVNSVDPRGASVVVERGSLRANIVHRKDTRWAFVAGPFNVRVTGTALRVSWRPDQKELDLSVDDGSVVAEGPLLGDGRVVRQGERCTVRLATSQVQCGALAGSESGVSRSTAPVEGAPVTDAAADAGTTVAEAGAADRDISRLPLVARDAAEGNSTMTPAAPIANASRFATVHDLEKAGKYAEALKTAERMGIEYLLYSGSAEDLFCLSRLGRYQGRPALERSALVKIRGRFVKTKESANAAFLLGRQSAPGEAARWFSTYLAEQPKGIFAREAAGRLVESLHHAGQFSEAQAAARRYLNAYPSGPHAGFAKSLLANP